MTVHVLRIPRFALRVVLLPLMAMATVGPASATTSCNTTPSCSATCTPSAPVAISTLITAASFPSGANIPIAFVDPGDGSSRRLVATQQGEILVWDGSIGTLLPTPFLDLRDPPDGTGPVLFSGERGLLAMVADPDYGTNGRLYVYYTRGDGDIVVERYQRSAGNPAVGDPGSATTLLVIEHSSAGNHNGGWIAFGLDGFLYISTGDGGGGCDGNLGISGDGQRNDTLLGKMLRIDVRGIDPSGHQPDNCGIGSGYTIPSTNPFFGQTTPCEEVYLMGLRNPFRFSIDRATGDLYIGDVGQGNWEEIDLKRAATPVSPVVNFGWPCREGCNTSNTLPSGCQVPGCPTDSQDPADPSTTPPGCFFPRNTGFGDPVLCHSSSAGWHASQGGYRYRGTYVPSIAGSYFYGDTYCGQVWKTTTLDPATPSGIAASCWASGYTYIYSFAEDHLGELYVVQGIDAASQNRAVSCIHNGLGCFWAGFAGFLADGFESGDKNHWNGGSTPP